MSVGGGNSTDKANKGIVTQSNNFIKKNSGSEVPPASSNNLSKASKSFANKKDAVGVSSKPKFKMEVDLSALNGRVHFADEEKFMIPSQRNNESAKSQF